MLQYFLHTYIHCHLSKIHHDFSNHSTIFSVMITYLWQFLISVQHYADGPSDGPSYPRWDGRVPAGAAVPRFRHFHATAAARFWWPNAAPLLMCSCLGGLNCMIQLVQLALHLHSPIYIHIRCWIPAMREVGACTYLGYNESSFNTWYSESVCLFVSIAPPSPCDQDRPRS